MPAKGKSYLGERLLTIQNYPKPFSKRQLGGLLGFTVYCRLWGSSFSELLRSLHKFHSCGTQKLKMFFTGAPGWLSR